MVNDYFAVFGLKPALDIDLAELNKKYLVLQAQFHPDKFIGNGQASIEKSAEINRSYGVLKDRFKRAEYLLGELKADPETLLEIMELRESYDSGAANEVKKNVGELFTAMSEDYQNGKRDDAAKKFVKIKYLNKFLEDVAANS